MAAEAPSTVIATLELVLTSGRTEEHRLVVGEFRTHLQRFPLVAPVFRFPYDSDPAFAPQVSILGTRTFYASDLGVGTGFLGPAGLGLTRYDVQLAAPVDNLSGAPVLVVPAPDAHPPFTVAPKQPAFISEVFSISISS